MTIFPKILKQATTFLGILGHIANNFLLDQNDLSPTNLRLL